MSTTSNHSPHDPGAALPEVASLFGDLAELPAAERATRLRVLDLEAPDVARELRALLDIDADRHDFLGLFTFALTGATRNDALQDATRGGATWTTPEPVATLAPSVQVGPYRLLRELGRGGMGSVWLARDHRLARDVALKFLPGSARIHDEGDTPNRSTRALQRTRFLVEARAAAAIDHPHVASVYDIGADAAADLWALGVTMYECLSGQRPFTGDSMASLMHAVLHTDPAPLTDRVPTVPVALAALVQQLLDKDPRRRPTSALAVEQALREGRALGVPTQRTWTRFTPPPSHLTTFLGRERDVEELASLVHAERLVTVTGAGGSGKTRLAAAVASRCSATNRFAEGRCAWVDLTGITESALVGTQVAATLRAPERSDGSQLDVIRQAIGPEPLLLVVDNCEQVLDGVALLIDGLLAACPAVHVLATSREVLNVGGEHAWSTPGLNETDARSLFVQRARAAQASFELTPDLQPIVDEICTRLDGMPLAIELAAARVRTMPLSEIRTRLSDVLQLLSSGSRTALPRQRTLRGTMEWSHDLLKLRDRIVLRRLAVFTGGFRLDFAASVAGGAPESGDEAADHWPILTADAVQDGVLSLVDKSLVVAYEVRDIPRFRLLETVRQYAMERLDEAGELALARARHARAYLALAEEMAPKFVGGAHTPGLMARIIVENDNFRAAVNWTVDEVVGPPDRAELALRFAAALFWYWHSSAAWVGTARYGELSDFTVRALARGTACSPSLRAEALTTLGLLGLASGTWESAAAALTDARQLRMDSHDVLARVWVDAWYAAVCLMRGKFDEGWQIAERAWQTVLPYPPSIVHTVTTSWRGLLAVARGDLRTAREMQEINCRLGYEIGHTTSSAHAEAFLGTINLLEARIDDAEQNFRRSYPMHYELLDGWGLALDLDGLCGVTAARAQFAQTAQLLGAVDAWRRRLGIAVPAFAAPLRAQHEAQARSALGSAMFDAHYAEGRALSPHAAIAAVLT